MVGKLLNAMLIFVPLALLAEFVLHLDPVLIFILAALGIIPLAHMIGHATEELAIHTGPKLGGLLNATLGNAAELIITIFALREGLLDLVRASITGSIIGNLLLVLGLSLLVGGLKNGLQTFDRRTAGLNATLVILALVALAVPSLFDVAIQENLAAELGLSEGVALIMILLYGLMMVYNFTGGAGTAREPAVEETIQPHWSVQRSLVVLTAATLGIVFMSEVLV